MISEINRILKMHVARYRLPVIELIEEQTKDPFRILVGTILSARTKDEVTKEAVKRLFRKAKNPKELQRLSEKQIQELIYPVGFYKNKAKQLKQLPEALQRFRDKVPSTIEDLVTLPGVGRKTANLVVAVGFKKPAICVDTHVHRIMNRIGYVKTKTPLETEMALREKLPKRYWITLNTYLVAYGQHLCTPVSPWCSKCVINKYCKQVGVAKSR